MLHHCCTLCWVEWVIVVVRVPSEPSRHRVAVWRELRRAGAIPLAAGTWALPATPLTVETVDKVRDLIARAPDGVPDIWCGR